MKKTKTQPEGVTKKGSAVDRGRTPVKKKDTSREKGKKILPHKSKTLTA